MKFLANMGISPVTVTALRAQGHDVLHPHEEGLDRLADHKIVLKARREGRVILTSDLDFGELLALGSESLPSVVIFRLANMRPRNVNKHLAEVLARFHAALAAGAIIAVTESKIRVRLLPIAEK